MIDTKKEAIRGDKAARDLMLSELLQVCTQKIEEFEHTLVTENSIEIIAAYNLMSAGFKRYEALAYLKLIALAPTIAAELIKERAVNAKLLKALKYLLEREWQDDEGDATLTTARKQANLVIKQAEEL